MDSRTLLLTLHIASVTAWLGADVVQLAIERRFAGESQASATAWARVQVWLHARYYAVVVVVILVTGILLVLDGDWSWSSGFIWVGIGAIVGGGILGGGGLGSLAQRRVAALESGDEAGAAAAARGLRLLGYVVTALPVIALLAMVDKWAV